MKTANPILLALVSVALAPGAAFAQADSEILGYSPKKPMRVERPAAKPSDAQATPLRAPYTAVKRYPEPKSVVEISKSPPQCIYKPVMTDEEIRSCTGRQAASPQS
jgi:hypothetical protein